MNALDKLTKANIDMVIDVINSDASLQARIADYLRSADKKLGGTLTETEAAIFKARLVMDVALRVF